MEIQYLESDLNIIQKLDDEPNDVGGLTAQELKAKFDEAGNLIKDYINNRLIPAVLSANYITEQGQSGIWTYRKWAGGIAECWGTKAVTLAINSTGSASSSYYSDPFFEAFPTGLFISRPTLTINIAQGGSLTAYCGAASYPDGFTSAAATPNLRLISLAPVPTAFPYYIALHAIGRWKEEDAN